jgi:polynucleotide 5'-hydroxyl-kinase GRC3/NOL9
LIPDQTEEDEDEDQTPPIILVKGPKRSGKSTFARATLNNLLNRYEKVAWLECDLGQGEFSPGAVVGIWMINSPILGTSLFPIVS